MALTFRDYSAEQVEAARSVLLELVHLLARIRVSSVVAFLVMKGMALHDRLKEKDAWDIYFTLLNYEGGIDALIDEIKPHLDERNATSPCRP